MTLFADVAICREAGGKPEIERVEIGLPQAGEVLVRIVATGVCHTDMVMRDGHLPVPRPVVLGHEGAGHVVAVGPGVTHVAPGDAVVLSFASCGDCPSCRAQVPGCCHHFFERNFHGARADGSTAIHAGGEAIHSHIFGQSSFGTYAIASARGTVKVPGDLPLELMGPFGCGFLTGAGTVLNALRVGREESLLVLGAGAVGLAAVMAARIAGASRIMAIDRSEARTRIALDVGATGTWVSEGPTLAQLDIGCFDHIIDTTGSVALIEQAMELLEPRGRLALVAAFAPGSRISLDAAHMMSGGRIIQGVVEGAADPQRLIPFLIEKWKAGDFPVERLIETFPFDRIADAIEAGETGRVIKPVVRMTDVEA